MTQVQAPPPARRRGLGWAMLLPVDIGLGYLAAFPIYAIVTGLAHLTTIRLRSHDPGFWWGEGADAAVALGSLMLGSILLLVVAVNEPLRRWMRLQAGRFWLIVAGLFLLPTVYVCLVVLWSGLF